MDMVSLVNLIAELPDGEVSVLATVVRVNGHAYRKEGAAMLFLQEGRRAGSVSAGCLEEDLQARTASVASSGKHVCATCNLRSEEDIVWGESMGCGGEITILLEAVSGELFQLLDLIGIYAAKGIETLLVREWDDDAIAYTLGTGNDAILAAGPKIAAVGRNAVGYPGSQHRVYGYCAVAIKPKPRLILFGDGADARAVADIADGIGFRCVIADWREGRGGDAVIGTPAGIVNRLRLKQDDYLLLCSHRFHQERELLGLVLPLRLRYIGILGSQARIRRLFDGLNKTPNVHAPVGLAIGADGPKEIAVSIAAQLIAIRHAAAAETKERTVAHEDRSDLFGGRLQPANG